VAEARREDMTEAPEPPRLYLITPPLADATDFAPRLEAALAAGDVACVLLRSGAADEHTTKKLVKLLAPVAQKHDAALLIDAPRLAARAGADGANLRVRGEGLEQAMEEALSSLKPQRIVGVSGLKKRHDSMIAGEHDVDYVMFGDPAPDGFEPPFEDTLERVAWWAEIFNVPCVGYAPRLADVGPLAEAGADFVALGGCVWSDPRGEAQAVAEAMKAIAQAPRPAA
jgi:thiamine-phosphate pyrophosphorylase